MIAYSLWGWMMFFVQVAIVVIAIAVVLAVLLIIFRILRRS